MLSWGGTGSTNKRVLPPEIEHAMPDYALYGITDMAYGFLSRGCPRHCPFCIVGDKEGLKSHKVADLNEWWTGQKTIKLLDPNLLACPDHLELLRQLVASKSYVDVTQGFDARMLTPQNTELINQLKVKMLHFAYDNPDDKLTERKLKEFRKTSKIRSRELHVYVLTNYKSTHEQDLYRVNWLRDNGYDPYVMIYNKWDAPKITRDLQRYVNSKFIFHSCKSFDEYKKRQEDKEFDELETEGQAGRIGDCKAV